MPENPMDRDDVEVNALEMIVPYLGQDRARKLVDEIWRLEKARDLKRIVKLMAC
jgi:hypothetical protein